jgi:hypothetical protein
MSLRRSSGVSRSVLAPVREPFRALVITFVPEASSLTPDAWAEGEALVEAMLLARPAGVRRQIPLLIRALDVQSVLRSGRPCRWKLRGVSSRPWTIHAWVTRPGRYRSVARMSERTGGRTRRGRGLPHDRPGDARGWIG